VDIEKIGNPLKKKTSWLCQINKKEDSIYKERKIINKV